VAPAGLRRVVSPNITLQGWGRASAATSRTTRPERDAQAVADFRAPTGPGGLCLHGAGRSYGDCALNDGGAALITTRLDRILAFDADTGIVEVEPGVTFTRLLAVFLPRGFVAPVTPGTGFATIGGAVANDVHGKNHEQDGSFCQHVVALDLVLPDGTARTIAAADGAIFRATCAGLGMTGFITRIAFRMKRVPGQGLMVREIRAGSLDAFLAAMQAARGASYSVGWIDGTATGGALGRGILETAEFTDAPVAPPSTRTRAIPVDFPAFALNPISVRAFNAAYFRRVPQEGRVRNVHAAKFLYPLDAIHGWNRIYGKRGFYQFQCVVPFDRGEEVLRGMLRVITASHRASFLAVLKRMGPGRAGFLSFPMAGYTLALDFPSGDGVAALYATLTRMTKDAGGRIYLGKDALMTADDFRTMYPEFPAFRAVLSEIDPNQRMQSDMAKRLKLHEK
jgi:decaprenylphospho-beta-D-ribofuranose 2-oxidase